MSWYSTGLLSFEKMNCVDTWYYINTQNIYVDIVLYILAIFNFDKDNEDSNSREKPEDYRALLTNDIL